MSSLYTAIQALDGASLLAALSSASLEGSVLVMGTLQTYLEQPISTVITAARTSYPWPLHLGNSIYAVVAYRQVRDAMPEAKRPGTIAGIAVAFTMYAMAGGLAACLIMLGQPPSALQSSQILPVFVALWFAVHYCPGDLLYALLSQPTVFFILGNLAELDGFTTGLNYMEEVFPMARASAIFPVSCGLSVMLTGGVARHFAEHGFSEGLARFDDEFRSSALFYAAIFAVYYHGAILPCAGDASCAHRTGLYEALPLLGVARNLALEGLAALSPAASVQPAAKAKAD